MYKVEISNKGDSVFNVRSKDYEFNVDTKGKGMTPPDTLLASLGSCMGVYIRKYAEGAKLNIGNFKIGDTVIITGYGQSIQIGSFVGIEGGE